MTGVERIAAERRRQIEQCGYTAQHDDQHRYGELAAAAACYAAPERIYVKQELEDGVTFSDPFPWEIAEDDRRQWGHAPRPELATVRERIELLAKAGALIAAEIDRLERAVARIERALRRSV